MQTASLTSLAGMVVVALAVVAVIISNPATLPEIEIYLPCSDDPSEVDTNGEPVGEELNHADIKHGLEAEVARQWVAEHGKYCRWDCGEKIVYMCVMDDGKYAILILDAITGKERTAFITDKQGYACAATVGGFNPWHYSTGHP